MKRKGKKKMNNNFNMTKKYIDKLHGKEVLNDSYSYLTWLRRSHYYLTHHFTSIQRFL